MKRRRLVRVPASSANLGPGFDVLAAALALHLELEVEETGRFAVETDLDVARDRAQPRRARRSSACTRPTASRSASAPTSRSAGGLGSSAAADRRRACMAADHLFELDADLLALATELEGHPDNVAAALLGGVRRLRRRRSATRFDAPAGLEAVLVVPHDAGAHAPRRAPRCPPRCRWPTRCSTSRHASLLVLGLAQRRLGPRRRAGSHDRLHQPRRAHLYPRSMDARAARARELGALGATISGAGPTVLVWTPLRADRRASSSGLRGEAAGWADVMRVPVRAAGRRRASV